MNSKLNPMGIITDKGRYVSDFSKDCFAFTIGKGLVTYAKLMEHAQINDKISNCVFEFNEEDNKKISLIEFSKRLKYKYKVYLYFYDKTLMNINVYDFYLNSKNTYEHRNAHGRLWIKHKCICFWSLKNIVSNEQIYILANLFKLDYNQTKVTFRDSKDNEFIYIYLLNDFVAGEVSTNYIDLINRLHTVHCNKKVPDGFGSKMIKGNLPIAEYQKLRYNSER